jgi:hypothetical protein
LNLRVLAISVLATSAAVLCVLPLLLEYLGSAWKPVAKVVAGARESAEVAA